MIETAIQNTIPNTAQIKQITMLILNNEMATLLWPTSRTIALIFIFTYQHWNWQILSKMLYIILWVPVTFSANDTSKKIWMASLHRRYIYPISGNSFWCRNHIAPCYIMCFMCYIARLIVGWQNEAKPEAQIGAKIL